MLVKLAETKRLTKRKAVHIAPTREYVPKRNNYSRQSLPVRQSGLVTSAEMCVTKYIGSRVTNLRVCDGERRLT